MPTEGIKLLLHDMALRPRCRLQRVFKVPASEAHGGWLFDHLSSSDRINDHCRRICRVCGSEVLFM